MIDQADTKVIGHADTKVIGHADTKAIGHADTKAIGHDTKVIGRADTKVIDQADTKIIDRADTKVIGQADTKVTGLAATMNMEMHTTNIETQEVEVAWPNTKIRQVKMFDRAVMDKAQATETWMQPTTSNLKRQNKAPTEMVMDAELISHMNLILAEKAKSVKP